ncbi:MAG: hypothetical protein KGM47_10800, partial [Acidobacteriota bacterium]|nr:hypothetical protein [Acidobacteriota bacterium]
YWRLAPLVPWFMLFNFLAAGFIRRIEWGGTSYELESIDRLRILHRSEPGGDPRSAGSIEGG